MRILLIRHGDPDYVNDSLTPKGFREAQYLAQRLFDEKIDHIYVSPLGRAKATAKPYLDKTGRDYTECDWLREFSVCKINRPDREEPIDVCWDWLPADWTIHGEFYDKDKWMTNPVMTEGGIDKYYSVVTESFDKLLAKHGYVHEGNFFRVEQSNDDTIALFCHFGLGCVLLGHLLGISPMQLWHGFAAPPTSVTTIMTEERRKGVASFRVVTYGDVTHLTVNKEPPSFSARFCETYDNEDERHD